MLIGARGLLLSIILAAAPAAAQSIADPATAFGARESIESISLSPDGRRIAYVAPGAGQGSRVFTVDLVSGESSQITAVDGTSQRLSSCGWVATERLLCRLFALRRVQNDVGGAVGYAALDADGSDVTELPGGGSLIDWLPGQDGVVLVSAFTQNAGRSNPGVGVIRVDTRNGRTSLIEPPIPRAGNYISDGRGRVRVYGAAREDGETQMATGNVEFRYRPAGSGDWRSFGFYNHTTRDGMLPLAVDAALNAAYVLEKLDGRLALYRVALDGSGRKEMLVASEQVDVDGVVRLGRGGRVIGATYVEETRKLVYFDPELHQLAANLSRAIPNLPLIHFAGASDDENILLVWAGSDRDPGRYYTYDKRTRALNEIMLVRPELEGMPLAEMRAIRFPAADGTMIPGYLTLPPGGEGRGLPAIVLPHGGPDARDEWGFNWLVQYLAHRGYAVLQPNFRGSGGYGDEWFRNNGFRSWPIAIGDVSDAGRWLVAQGIADPARLAILGWSYGGYAALQSAAVTPDLFKAVVAIAPVTDLEYLREEARGWTDFRLMREFIGSGPHVREGSPANRARSITAPVLMFHGDHDANVSLRHSELMNGRLREAGGRSELIVLRGLDHQIEDSAARANMLRRTDLFLRQALGIQ